MKIFLLEDDFSLNKIINDSLIDRGFFVDSFLDGYKAVQAVLSNIYDIYIIDLNVAGFDGHQILEIIGKEHKTLPVVIISAALDLENIKKSYDLGCNDYLKKPFDFEELFLHIKYLIKSIYQNDQNGEIELGYGFRYSIDRQTLHRHSHEITLTQNEKLLLDLLILNIGKVVAIETIHDYVWGGKMVEAVSMRSLVYKLQKKLKNGMIVNIRGVGYKLISP